MPRTTRLAIAPEPPTLPDLLTFPEAGALARVSPYTVRRWVTRGELPTVRLGGRVFVRRDALAAYIDAGNRPATTGPLTGRIA